MILVRDVSLLIHNDAGERNPRDTTATKALTSSQKRSYHGRERSDALTRDLPQRAARPGR
jgi:hypothetical protein